jgi:hypothetical protein
MMKRIIHGCTLIAIVCLLASLWSGDSPRAQASNRLLFAALGDVGTGKAEQYSVAQAMARAHAREPFELVLMLGDNFYGSADYVKKFEKPYETLLARGVRFHAALGNHDDGKADKEIFYDKFNMGGRRYYSFARGERLAQFFALDSNRMTREQLAWLEEELAASKARWKIAYFHHPIYSSGKTHGADTKLRSLLEPLFVKYGVQLVLSGHEHFYERLKPRQGVQYFISGAGGKLRRNNLKRDDPDFAFGNDQAQHFMLFEAMPEALSYRAISDADEVLDSGALTSHNRPRTVTGQPDNDRQ